MAGYNIIEILKSTLNNDSKPIITLTTVNGITFNCDQCVDINEDWIVINDRGIYVSIAIKHIVVIYIVD